MGCKFLFIFLFKLLNIRFLIAFVMQYFIIYFPLMLLFIISNHNPFLLLGLLHKKIN